VELTVACRVCRARFSARLAACPACGLERPAARTQRQVEEGELVAPEVRLQLPGTRLAPNGSALGIWLLAIAVILFIGRRNERALLLPSIVLFVAGLVALVYGLRRAHRQAKAAASEEPPDEGSRRKPDGGPR
jgi:hypothetical protein